MPHDYEDVHDLDDLSDDELREVVREHLNSHPGLDIDDITITVEDGVVTVGGRVGTVEELRMAQRIVTDQVGVGVGRFESELVLDEIRRGEAPAAVDDHLAEEDRESGLLLGDRPRPLEPVVDEVEESLDARLFGTSDVQKAIADGTPWNPPQNATPEGLGGTETSPEESAGEH